MLSHGQDGDERQWQQVLQLLSHPSEAQQLACLTELQQWLSFATDEHLGTFPLQRVLHALFQLLQGRAPDAAAAAAGCGQTGTLEGSSQMDPDVANPAATASQEALDEQLARELSGGTDEQGLGTQRDLLIGSCVYLLLDVLPVQTAAILARTPDYMEALKHQLSHLQYIDTGERFLLIICRVVEEQPLLALLSGAAAAMLPILDFFQLDIQRKAVRAAAKALAAAAAATEKAVAAAAAETAARRHNLTCLPQEQRGATEFAPSTGTSGRKEGSDAGVGAGARSSSSRSKLVALREHLRQQLQLEKQQQRELLEQLDEYRSLINPTLPFFSSLLTYKDEALLQGACQSWRSTLSIFVCVNTAAAASAAAVAGLELAAVRAAATAGGEDSGKPHSSQQQQEGQQQQEDAEWLSVCQKAYADHMELLSSELAAFGTEAAVALQQLVARTVAESSSGALAWQQQLMLQDALYVLSVFAAYSDTIAAELLRQQKQTANFQEAIAKLVRKQEMLLLEGVAAYGVSLLPAVHFQLPLWQEVLQRQQTEAAGAEAAAAADVLTVDAKRVSVFAESPELLGRALETFASPMLPLLESSVTRDLCRFVLQLLLAAAYTAAKASSNQQLLQQQLLDHLDCKTLGEICAHALHRGLPGAVKFAVMSLILQLLLQRGAAAAAALQVAGVRDRVEADFDSSTITRRINSRGGFSDERHQKQNSVEPAAATFRFATRAGAAAAAAAAGEPIACVDLAALLRHIRKACVLMFELHQQNLQLQQSAGAAPPCSAQLRLQHVALSLLSHGSRLASVGQEQQDQQEQWLALVELRKLLEAPQSVSACELINSRIAEALCCYLLGIASSSSTGSSCCCKGTCHSDSCSRQQELKQRGLLFMRAFLFPLTENPPPLQQRKLLNAGACLDGVDWSAASPNLLIRLATLAAKCLSRVEQFPVLQQQLPAVAAAARDVLPPHLRAPRPLSGATPNSAAVSTGRQSGYRTAGLQQRQRPGPRGLRMFHQLQQQQLPQHPGEFMRQQLLQQHLLQQPDPLLVMQDLQRDVVLVARDLSSEQAPGVAFSPRAAEAPKTPDLSAVSTPATPTVEARETESGASQGKTTNAEPQTPGRPSRRRFRSRTVGVCRSPAQAIADAAQGTAATPAVAATQDRFAGSVTSTRKEGSTSSTPQRAGRNTRSKAAGTAAPGAKASIASSNINSSNSNSMRNRSSGSNESGNSNTNRGSNSSATGANNSGCLIKRRRGQPGSSGSSNSNAPPPSTASGPEAAARDSSNGERARGGRGTVPSGAGSDSIATTSQRSLQRSSYSSNSSGSGAGLTAMQQLQQLVLQHQRGNILGDLLSWGHRYSGSASNSSNNALVVDCRAPLSRVESEIRRTLQMRQTAEQTRQQQMQRQARQQHQSRDVEEELQTEQGLHQQEQDETSSSSSTRGGRRGQRASGSCQRGAENEVAVEQQVQQRPQQRQQVRHQQRQLRQRRQEEEDDASASSDSMDVDSHLKAGRRARDDEQGYGGGISEEDIPSSSSSSSHSSSSSDSESAVIFERDESGEGSSHSSSCNSSTSSGTSEDEGVTGPNVEGREDSLRCSAAETPDTPSDPAPTAEALDRAAPRLQCGGAQQQQQDAAAVASATASAAPSSISSSNKPTAASVGAIQLYVHSVPVPPQMPVIEALNLYGGCVALPRRSSGSIFRDSSSSGNGWLSASSSVAHRRLQQMLQGGSSTFEMLLSTALLADLLPNSRGSAALSRQRGEVEALSGTPNTRRPITVAATTETTAATADGDPRTAISAPPTCTQGSSIGGETLQVDVSGRFCIMIDETAESAPAAAVAAEATPSRNSLWDKAHTVDYLVLPATPKARNSSGSSSSPNELCAEGLKLGRGTPLVTSVVHPALGAERLLQQLQEEQQQQQEDPQVPCLKSKEHPRNPQEQQHLEDLAGWCVSRTQKETTAAAAYLRGDCNSWHRLDLLLHAASDEAAPLFYGIPSAGVSVTRHGSSTGRDKPGQASAATVARTEPAIPRPTAAPAAYEGNVFLPSVFDEAAAAAAPFVVLLLYLHNLLQQLPQLHMYASVARSITLSNNDDPAPLASAATKFGAAASARALREHPLGLCSSNGNGDSGAAAAAEISCWSSVAAKAGAVLADPVAAVTSCSRTPYWLRRLVFACPFLFPLQLRLLLLLQQHLGAMRGQFIYKVRLKEAAELLLGQRQGSSSSSSSVQPLLNLPTAGISSSKALLLQRLRPVLQLQGAASGGSSNRREQEILADLEGGASLPRTKVKMPRAHLVESAAKVMDHLLASSRSSEEQPVLEVEFAGEEGVGQGPTNEFYAEVLEALLTWKEPELFLNCSSGGGLFPRAYLTDLCLIPLDMVRRPRVSPLVQQQQPQRMRSRAPTRRTDRGVPSEGAEDMEEDAGPFSNTCNASSNASTIGFSQQKPSCTAAAPSPRAVSASGGGTLELQLFSHFRLLGQLAAKALLDGRSSTTDIGLHTLFWEAVARPRLHQERLRPCSCMSPAAAAADVEAGTATARLRFGICYCGGTAAAVAAVAAIDEALGRSLQQMLQHRADGHEVKDMACSFVIPQDGGGPLVEGGENIFVSNASLDFFIQRLAFVLLCEGIFLQASAFRLGFGSFCPLFALSPLLPMEVSSVLFGDRERTRQDRFWTLSHLRAHVAPDHGFTTSSAVYGHFLEVLVDFNPSQRAAFLKFVTGSTILPAGGFAGFRPLMKVVRKTPASGGGAIDCLLPSVMTCSNYIKLPNYSSKQILKERLLLALEEGQGAFTLS